MSTEQTTGQRRKRAPKADTSAPETFDPGEARIQYMPLSEIARWPRNPKKHDKREIRASLVRNGFVEVPTVAENLGKLVAGHGRIEVAEEMRDAGETPPARVRVREDGEWLIPVLRGLNFRSERDAEAYVLASNRTTEKGGWDDAILADILRDHAAELDGTGYSAGEVDDILASLEATAAEVEGSTPTHAPDEFKEISIEVETDYRCPSCGYEWKGKAK